MVGLAPGLHGAGRTGRAFTGDASGDLLFAALYKTGFASTDSAASARLQNLSITNAVKCLPPQNTVKAQEVNACAGFLRAELEPCLNPRARNFRVVVALGGVAFRAVQRLSTFPRVRFAHAAEQPLAPRCVLLGSFHPSRLNANTGRIDEASLITVFRRARVLIKR